MQKTEGAKHTRIVRFYPYVSTGNAPRKGRRIPLNKIKNNEQRDEETGYSYFGARYMDHEHMTMWLSVDPLVDKYPSISPYAYCAWNPVKLVDENGEEPVKPLIRYMGGGQFWLNVDNLHTPTKVGINWAKEHGKWEPGHIGVDLTVREIYAIPTTAHKTSALGVKPEHTSIAVQPPIAKSTGLPDRRFKPRTITSGPGQTPSAKYGLGMMSLFFTAADLGIGIWESGKYFQDRKELNRQQAILTKAFNMVSSALNNNIIPADVANNIDLVGGIVDYVFQGRTPNINPICSKYGEIILKNNNLYDQKKERCIPLLESYSSK